MKKRIQKATLMLIRKGAYRWNILGPYYWADARLHSLRSVYIMPNFYYRWLYGTSMKLVQLQRFQRLAYWAIHTIPLHVRFKVG